MPPPPFMRNPEMFTVPVFKNIKYALKLVWKCDKRLLLSYILGSFASNVFSLFIQNILFLKVLLSMLDTSVSFGDYAVVLLCFLFSSAFLLAVRWGSNYVVNVSDKVVLKNLNNMIFEKAITLDIECYENPQFYDKYQRATDVLAFGFFDLVCSAVADILSSVFSLCLVIGTVSIINPMYLVFLIPTLFVFGIETLKTKLFFKRDMEMTKNNRIKSYIQRTVFLKDYSKDMRTSNIFAVLSYRFKAAVESNVEILKKYGFKLFLYGCVSSLFSEFIPICGTYAYAAFQFVYKKSLTVSSFSVVISSINTVREATMCIARSFESLMSTAVYFQNLNDFFDYEPKIVSGKDEPKELETLEFKNVSFKYPSAQKYSLKNVSFKISKGETVALVGANGAGKSTLVKLLLRFYDPVEGEILYNGKNIKEYNLEKYRNIFGAVFQDYKNFAVSVFENVMCKECDKSDKEKAQTALEQSGIWKKISSFENAGETVLTREFQKDGLGLSGGENQKVSAARLFAKKFEFAVLDEPSSALDPIAEYEMYENLLSITKDKAVLFISHRLSSAVLSDRIIVIENGTLTQQGSHEKLINEEGLYKKMFTLQASSYKKEA